MTQEIGTIDVNGMTVIYTEASALQSADTKKMYQYLPDKYKTDNSAVIVEDGNLYINIGLQSRATKEEATVVANEVCEAFIVANLSQFGSVEIVVNNEFLYAIVNGTIIER